MEAAPPQNDLERAPQNTNNKTQNNNNKAQTPSQFVPFQVEATRILFNENKLDTALQVINKFLKSNPSDPTALCLQAQIFHKQNRHQKALKNLDILCKDFYVTNTQWVKEFREKVDNAPNEKKVSH